MAELAEDFRTFLADDATIAGYVTASGVTRIHQNTIPDDKQDPYIWFLQSGVDYSPEIAPTAGVAPHSEMFDIECCAEKLSTAALLGKAVRNRCAFFRGTFGSITVQGVFVEDQGDDYQFRNDGSDVTVNIVALSVRVVPRV